MKLTVSSLVRYLKNRIDLDDNLQHIMVSGEISNFLHHKSGHIYFTLKDENASIKCVMFKSSATSLKFNPKDGDKVIVSANTSVFETSGTIQLYITKITLDGVGDLYARYEELKEKLTNEGYFLDEHKRTLPLKYLEKVAVLVGDQSAAMSDIKICFSRRWPLCKVDYYPVLVQGEEAPQDIIPKLLMVDQMGYDAIILARGGGSFEDLFCFNDESLVKTIYNLNTFIVCGIGHEQDFSLCDFVADLRAATPTAAVELITPNINEVYDDIQNNINRANVAIHSLISERKVMELDYYYEKLVKFSNNFKLIDSNLDLLNNRMKSCLLSIINEYKNTINNFKVSNKLVIKNKLETSLLHVNRYEKLLEAYSPDNVLNRGYSITKQGNRIIKSIKDIKLDEDISIHFIDGDINAKIKE